MMLSFFVCRTINTKHFLVADFSQACGDDTWFAFLPVAIPFSILYPFGVPLFFFYMLVSHHQSGQCDLCSKCSSVLL
jgi:hypothetical protein